MSLTKSATKSRFVVHFSRAFAGCTTCQNRRKEESYSSFICCNFHGVFFETRCSEIVPSVLWRCWLGGRKGIRPVKKQWWSAGVVVCLEQGADLHMAQLMPLTLSVTCFSKIQIGFTFLVPAHLGSPGKRAVKPVCVCVCVCVSLDTGQT